MANDDEEVVGGRYVLGDLLGRGGMAEVHQGYDQRLGRTVAVKQLSAHLAADPDSHVRFDREAHAAASLNHPAIASVFDTGEDTDPDTGIAIPYIVMELVDGETLRALLRQQGPMPVEQALSITSDVLSALEHSHAAGIIHRDIKPSNVMVTSTGAVKVMDFGIARAVDDTSNGLTQTAVVVGTAQYFSPEQASGRPVDPRSDLYSVGCLLYELLTGRPPFVGESQIAVAFQHVREPAAPPSSVNPAIPPAVDAVVLRALAKDANDRYQTAGQMRDDLDRLSAGLTDVGGASTVVAGPTVVAPPAVGPMAVAAVPPVAPVSAPVVAEAAPPVDPVEEPLRSRAGRIVLIALAAALALTFAVVALTRLLPTDGDPSNVAVPALIGVKQAAAEAELRKLGLEPEVKKVHLEDDKSVGTVTGVSPAAGSPVAPGSVVTIEVNDGPAEAKIPKNLVGEQIKDAEAKLEAAGFTNVNSRPVRDESGKAEDGEVLKVSPDEGESAALDAKIVLRYVGSAESTEPTTEPDDPQSTKEPTTEPTEAESSAGGETTAPTETTEPTSTADPTKTAKPTKTPKAPKPSKTAKPVKTGKPVATVNPSASVKTPVAP